MTLLILMVGGILGWLVADSIASGIVMRKGLKQGSESCNAGSLSCKAELQKMEQVFTLLRAKMSEEELQVLAAVMYNEVETRLADDAQDVTPFALTSIETKQAHIEAARAAEKFVKESLFRHYGEKESE